MRFIDWGGDRYVSVPDLVEMLVEYAPVVRDKVGADWPVANIIAEILVRDVRDPSALDAR